MTKTRIIYARYKGKDGSLGYRKGEIYSLIVNQNPNNFGNMSIQVVGNKPHSWCPYKDWATFLVYWDVIDNEAN